MKTKTIIVTLILVACAPGTSALTETPIPTATSTPLPPTPTATLQATPTIVPSTPIPTLVPPPILTPDAIQVERWQEYQTELAKALFVYNPSFPYWGYGPDAYTDALCEWDILRQRDQEVYVWATCLPVANSPLNGNSRVMRQNPAVIHLESDGAIREVNVGIERTDSRSKLLVFDLDLFPVDLQGILCSYYF